MTTRDSVAWIVGRLVALVLALGGLSKDALLTMGIPPTWQPSILLAAFVVGIVSGTLGNSPLKGQNDQ